MNDELIRSQIHQAVDHHAEHMQSEPFLAQRIMNQERIGNTVVNKSLSKSICGMPKRRFIALAATIILITASIALAASGALDALISIWQDSFNRMNTTGDYNVIDEQDVPEYLDQFEDDYGGVKDDLIISTVPGNEDLSLDNALAIARNAIVAKYGIDETVLDSMGVYPQFYKTPYQDEPSEWYFYFTSLSDTNIDEDHECPAPGEFRVNMESPSGNITYCNWYNDDFWTNGDAERVWEAGKYDAVLEQARTNQRFNWLNSIKHSEWIARFEGMGLDVSKLVNSSFELSRGLLVELQSADPSVSVLLDDDPMVGTALAEIECRYGITKQMFLYSGYIAVYGPDEGANRNIIILPNHELRGRIREEKNLQSFQSDVYMYTNRLGAYSVLIDPDTNSVNGFIRVQSKVDDNSLLLGRNEWNGNDWPVFCQLMDEAGKLDMEAQTNVYPANISIMYFHRLMRSHGGNPTGYPLPDPDSMLMSYEEAESIAVKVVSEKTGYDESKVKELWPDLSTRSYYYTWTNEDGSVKTVWDISFLGNETQQDWYVTIELPQKTITVTQNADANG